MDISVVICAFTERRWGAIRAAVDSVIAQSLAPKEVVVSIDHNRDLYERALRELTGVAVIESHQPQGLSGARNSGVLATSSDVVALLDDDARADPDWLRELLGPYIHADVLGAGGPPIADWEGGQPGWFPEEFNWVVGCAYRGLPAQRSRIRNPIGANMSFRRDVFDRIGGFRTGFGTSGLEMTGAVRNEETEFAIRAATAFPGGRWMHEPRARVHHHVPAERSTWRYFRSRCYVEGLSKAALRGMHGPRAALESERHYVRRTLPTGILRNAGEFLARRDPSAVARAGAIAAGLAFTAAGYVRGSIDARGSRRNAAAE